MAHHSSLFRNPQGWFLPALLLSTNVFSAELPEEKPLWAGAEFKNAIHYDVKETVRPNHASKSSLSGSNRVFSFVAEPTYSIHQAAKADANGVGVSAVPRKGRKKSRRRKRRRLAGALERSVQAVRVTGGRC